VAALWPVSSVAGTICDLGDPPMVPFHRFLGDCPPTISPARQPGSAELTVALVTDPPAWIEGGYFFMRATTADHRVAVHQRLTYEWEDPVGPLRPPASGVAYLPAGFYLVTVYGRSCGGNCGILDPPSYACDFPIRVAAGEAVAIEYDWRACEGPL
jgi:hypothetical protein